MRKDNDDARRHLLMRLRLGTIPSPLAVTAAATPYLIASTLILGFVIVGLFLRPPVIKPTQAMSSTLIVTPLTLDFGMVVAGDKQTRTLTVKNSSGLPLHWTADTSTVTIFFNAGEMSIPVKTTVTVITPGKLCVRPDHLDFGSLEQGTPGMRDVTVGDCGAQPLNWFIAPGKESWVILSSTQGTIGPGGQQIVQVTVDTSQLTPSSRAYSTSLTFNSDKGSQVISIAVTVALQPMPPKRVPNWSVNVMNLDPGSSKCMSNRSSWTCTVMLTEDTNSQGNINWSPTSNLGAKFDPPDGLLTPGGQEQVSMSSISCQNDTFTFYGAEGETPIMISWSCSLPCIKVDQPSLSITVMQGQPSKAQEVTFTNCGAELGKVSISTTTTDGIPWLNVSSVNTESLSGPLAPNMGQIVSVSVTSTNLQPGMYQGTITSSITTNAGTNTATTSITLTVSPCFTVNQSSLSFTYPGQVGIQEVTFTNCGTYAGEVSISSSTNDGSNWLSIDSYDSQQISGTLDAGAVDNVYFNVSARGLSPAIYQGTISATLTTNGIATTAPVSVTLTVLSPPHMTVSPSSLDFGSVQQGQQPRMQLTISNTGGQTLYWTLTTDPDVNWFGIDVPKGTIPANGQQTINVTLYTANLPIGTHSTTLGFNSNADNSPVQVTITLVVTLPPNMQLSTTNLSFSTCPSYPSSQNITITNTGGGTLTWTAGTPTYSYQGTPTPSASWLTVTLTSGSNSDTSGQSSTLTFTIDKSDIGDATVVITSADGETATVKVSVTNCIY